MDNDGPTMSEQAAATPRLARPFEDGRLALQLSTDAASFPFAAFAHALVRARNGTIVERLGAFEVDETYWDLAIDGQVLTLHRQHYLGVFLCATDVASEAVLETIVPFAANYLSGR